ncbi:hypothetical protein Q1M63_03740 (plasmid) [Sinorhizobium meliloti]|nr:hypothetical protein Q1M63_03740 [Sinorhizobium meliloti]
MADGSPGITMRQLAWAHDWHIPRSDIPPRSPFSSTPRYNCLANIFSGRWPCRGDRRPERSLRFQSRCQILSVYV